MHTAACGAQTKTGLKTDSCLMDARIMSSWARILDSSCTEDERSSQTHSCLALSGCLRGFTLWFQCVVVSPRQRLALAFSKENFVLIMILSKIESHGGISDTTNALFRMTGDKTKTLVNWNSVRG